MGYSASKADGAGRKVMMPLCGDRLFSVGGIIPARRPSSWLPRNASGWFPVQGYVFKDRHQLVLIDTGLAVHEAEVRAALKVLNEGVSRRMLLLTRREPDTLMNLPWIAREFPLASVQCAGPVDPFDFVERMDAALTRNQIEEMADTSVSFLTRDMTIDVEGFSIKALKPALRVLATDWFYESSTKSLFTSDTWGFVSCEQNPPALWRPSKDDIAVDKIVSHFESKFDWLFGVDTQPVADALCKVMENREIDRVCPTYGCVIEGSDMVKLLLANTLEALKEAGRQPFRRPVANFFATRANKPIDQWGAALP